VARLLDGSVDLISLARRVRIRTMSAMLAPSELEGCVLGHLWKHGPCTAYSIRKTLLDSPSSHWSGSAGAIYPLLARFEKRGLVSARKSMRGDRAGWLYSLRSAGREKFLAWVGPPLAQEVVAIAPDPLRTRVHFLKGLTPRRREAFFAASRAALEQHIDALVRMPEMDEFDVLAMNGAIRVARARIAWIDDVRVALSKSKRAKR
jgi:DNA-binding PadR family transcriptional regulator